ncbi:uncharacterized protein LOC116249942 [Nymphaea colorata]|uniref:uncharacterized protein LOC116249942 n=1 Tax=Nymphaea colorata TaxID=210225 RepID=UPI00129DA1B8|nr:uncharacterized protein LOC116249942 [Nymphaea colorata]
MGCVSSRMITRSGSYREDVTGNAYQRCGSAGVTVDLLLPKNTDQFLALICTASSFTEKLRSCPPPLPAETGKDVSEETAPAEGEAEVINAWELMADLDDEGSAASSDVAAGSLNPASEPSIDSQAVEEQDVVESDDHHPDGDQAGSKLTNPEGFPPADAFTDCEQSEPSRNIQAGGPAADTAEEPQASESSSIQCEEPGPSQSFYGTIEPSRSICTADQTDEAQGYEQPEAAGIVSRRRAKAKELAVLTIPTSLEFPVIGSLREWLQGGSTETPRFGDEVGSVSRSMSGRKQDSGGLDPELLQAFEEALAELDAEEQDQMRLGLL